jgi:pimeloyl-ACP methyl ester carboxylesterase
VIVIFLSVNVLLRQALLNPEELKESQLRILESRKGHIFKIPMCDSYILCYENIEKDRDSIIIYCHGNSGNIFKKQAVMDLLEKEKFSFCVFDYRGFGPTVNSFKPTVETMIEDTKRVLDFFSEKGFKIILWGESLGALIINKILKRYKGLNIYKIVFFSPFIGLKETLKNNGLSLLCLLFPALWNLSMEDIEYDFPILVVFSEEDNLCSKNSIKKVFDTKNLYQVVIRGSHSKPKIEFEDLMKIKSFLS